MKSALVLMSIFLASSVSAARLPNEKESIAITKMLKGAQSIKPLIDLIRSNQIDPFYKFQNFEPFSTPGLSYIAATILTNRTTLDNPVGLESENLELLKVIIEKGLDVNQKQTNAETYRDNTLLDLASRECSESVVELLVSSGADDTLEDFYWLNSFHKGFNYATGTINDIKCANLTMRFLESSKVIKFETAFRFLSGGYDLTYNPFLMGASLDLDVPNKMKNKLRDKFGLEASRRPTGAEPSGAWGEAFKKRLSAPSQNNDSHGPMFYLNWWPQYTDSEKAWACYYSSFDEMYPLLRSMGMSDEQIMHTPLPSKYANSFGEFAVKIFVPYCNSIRN